MGFLLINAGYADPMILQYFFQSLDQENEAGQLPELLEQDLQVAA